MKLSHIIDSRDIQRRVLRLASGFSRACVVPGAARAAAVRRGGAEDD